MRCISCYLQTARVPGGKPTTLQYFQSSASLANELLISAAMKDIKEDIKDTSGYDMASLPNLLTLPLSNKNRGKKDASAVNIKGWYLCKDEKGTDWDYDTTHHDNAD